MGGVKGSLRIWVSLVLAACLSVGFSEFASWVAMPSLASVFLMLELLVMMDWK